MTFWKCAFSFFVETTRGTLLEETIEIHREIADAIAEVEKKFGGEGRVLIRPSGTEPLVRVMIEGKDQTVIDAEAKKLADLITQIML